MRTPNDQNPTEETIKEILVSLAGTYLQCDPAAYASGRSKSWFVKLRHYSTGELRRAYATWTDREPEMPTLHEYITELGKIRADHREEVASRENCPHCARNPGIRYVLVLTTMPKVSKDGTRADQPCVRTYSCRCDCPAGQRYAYSGWQDVADRWRGKGHVVDVTREGRGSLALEKEMLHETSSGGEALRKMFGDRPGEAMRQAMREAPRTPEPRWDPSMDHDPVADDAAYAGLYT